MALSLVATLPHHQQQQHHHQHHQFNSYDLSNTSLDPYTLENLSEIPSHLSYTQLTVNQHQRPSKIFLSNLNCNSNLMDFNSSHNNNPNNIQPVTHLQHNNSPITTNISQVRVIFICI